MSTLIEFHGRLSRSDKRPANPGRYDLLFQLHSSAEGATILWTETLKGIDVAPGGFYYVILGQKAPLTANLFTTTPRWLSVCVLISGKKTDEHSNRVPVLGADVALGEQINVVEDRLSRLEHVLTGTELRAGRNNGRLRDWMDEVSERVSMLESRLTDEASPRQIQEIAARLEAIEGEDGRLAHLEDELDDIVGADGDIVDLNERMDQLEGRAPELIANLRAREGESGRERLERIDQNLSALRDRIGDVDRLVEALRTTMNELRDAPPLGPEAIGAVKRSGDVMTGGLTITRGGLDIASGGMTSRSAEISTLEVTTSVKTPKLLVETLELRGDMAVDSPRRVLQIRMVEGRHGSSKKDGPLHLNTRSGGEVVIGNADEHKGVEVHGQIRANAFVSPEGCVALSFDASGAPGLGEIVRLGQGGKARRTELPCDEGALGVVVHNAAVMLGGPAEGSRVAVAVAGVASCLAEASTRPILPGDRLVTGIEPGHAAKADASAPAGAIFGRALDGLEIGRGTIRVLIGSR